LPLLKFQPSYVVR